MGFLLSKNKEKKQLLVTEQDKAVLLLKQQRDKLKQYQKKINESLEKERLVARQLLHEGKKDKARLLLRKKKFFEQALDKTDAQLLNLETMVHDIEFAQIQVQVANGLKVGNESLKQIHELMSIDAIEKIMDETMEGVERQKEIDELLSGNLTSEDEEAVLEELDSILAEEKQEAQKKELAEDVVEDTEDLHLPDVPQNEPERVKKVKEQKREEIALTS